MEHLSLKRASGEGSFTGDRGRHVKKGPGYGNLSVGAPLCTRETWNQEGGTYTADFE
jgi:hypothetical protein